MDDSKDDPQVSGLGAEGTNTAQADISILGILAGRKCWDTHKQGVPKNPPCLYPADSKLRLTLPDALKIAAEDHHDGVGLITAGGIYQDGYRLVVITYININGPVELLQRFPTYSEDTEQGKMVLYLMQESWVRQYQDIEHYWQDDDCQAEIIFKSKPGSASFYPMSLQGKLPIAMLDARALDESLGPLLYEPPEQEAVARFPAPYPGPMADMVEAVLKVAPKPQPEMTLLSVLVAMAAVCGGFYALPGSKLSLYGCCIADTGDGKESARRAAISFLYQLGDQVDVLGKGTGPGLEDRLVSYTGLMIEVDELAHFFTAINGSRAPAYLIEFSAMLLKLFTDEAFNKRILAGMKEKPSVIHYPAVNLIGFATPEKLGRAMTADNITDGLLGRFLFVEGEKNPPHRRVHEALVIPKSILDAAKKIRFSVANAMQKKLIIDGPAGAWPIRVSVTPDADAQLDALMLEFDQCREKAPSSFARALYSRSFEKAERLAGVLAAWSNPGAPVITQEFVEWVSQVVRASDATLLRFAEDHMHAGEVQANAAKLKELMRRIQEGEFKPRINWKRKTEIEALKAKWIPRTLLLRELSKHMNSMSLDLAINHLLACGDLEIFEYEAAKIGNREYHPLTTLRLTEAAGGDDDE